MSRKLPKGSRKLYVWVESLFVTLHQKLPKGSRKLTILIPEDIYKQLVEKLPKGSRKFASQDAKSFDILLETPKRE